MIGKVWGSMIRRSILSVRIARCCSPHLPRRGVIVRITMVVTEDFSIFFLFCILCSMTFVCGFRWYYSDTVVRIRNGAWFLQITMAYVHRNVVLYNPYGKLHSTLQASICIQERNRIDSDIPNPALSLRLWFNHGRCQYYPCHCSDNPIDILEQPWVIDHHYNGISSKPKGPATESHLNDQIVSMHRI